MIGEAAAGVGAIKTALDIVKGFRELASGKARTRSLDELPKILFTAYEAQLALIKRVEELEKQLVAFERWDSEKERYELKEVYPGSFAYVVKEAMRGAEPAHCICARCYENRQKSILQSVGPTHVACQACDAELKVRDFAPLRGPNNTGGSWAS